MWWSFLIRATYDWVYEGVKGYGVECFDLKAWSCEHCSGWGLMIVYWNGFCCFPSGGFCVGIHDIVKEFGDD